jgi:hypothetical protein
MPKVNGIYGDYDICAPAWIDVVRPRNPEPAVAPGFDQRCFPAPIKQVLPSNVVFRPLRRDRIYRSSN